VLTADLVTARRRAGVLQIVPLDAQQRGRVEELAAVYLEMARRHVDRPREELEATWRAVAVAPRERRLADGVLKLVSDGCVFEPRAEVDPSALRGEVFLRASAARRALAPGGALERGPILAAAAAACGVAQEGGEVEIERLLYADLRGAERLCAVKPIRPGQLAAGFDLAQMQAVLLRATRVVAEVSAADARAYRRLFHKLKFLRLLHGISALAGPQAQKGHRGYGTPGYRIEIDGPFSLFQAVTRYGLQLAMALPAIVECGHWRVEAEVLWGRERQPVTFRAAGEEPPAVVSDAGAPEAPAAGPALRDEVAALLRRLGERESPWRATVATAILDLPGAGVCVPDLVFKHREHGTEVFLEVLGFWSREAVWRRVALVERGLPHRILFAVGKQLRVSEAALDHDLPGLLYVYARTMDPRAILERVERLGEKALAGSNAAPT
jgi:predicted nuclease of restriction endonuclease-like RecB superfamily